MTGRSRKTTTAEQEIEELTSMCEILEMAIKREESSYSFYMQARERATGRAEKELFYRLAQEELVHKQNLQRQKTDLDCQRFTDQALSGGEIGSSE